VGERKVCNIVGLGFEERDLRSQDSLEELAPVKSNNAQHNKAHIAHNRGVVARTAPCPYFTTAHRSSLMSGKVRDTTSTFSSK
jgi:hypothetical protein